MHNPDREAHVLARLEMAEERARKSTRETQEREAEAAQRASARDTAAPGYVAPSSAEELLTRYDRGERYFAGANLRGAQIKGRAFEWTNLAGADLTFAQVVGCTFESCNLSDAKAEEAGVDDCKLSACVVERFSLREAVVRSLTITSCALELLDLSIAKLADVRFQSCQGISATFKTASGLGTVSFADCRLASADLASAALSGTKFLSCNLSEANFNGADLTSADLQGSLCLLTRFEGARLGGANLKGTRFPGATIKQVADLDKIQWRGADLSSCNLSGTVLEQADLTSLVARHADFSDCRLAEADFSGAELHSATFKNAGLKFTNWRGAKLNSADFEGADLRFVKNIWFDQNNLYGAKLSPKGADPWTALRREYSGSRLAFHLVLLIGFFLPYVIRAATWYQVNQVQEAHAVAIESIRTDPELARALNITRLLTPDLVAAATSACLAERCKEWYVWELVVARNVAGYATYVAWLLLLYNVARLFLTWKVGPLRDDEDRTYVTPARDDYGLLYGAHRVVQIVFYVSFASFLLHAYEVLFKGVVSLPA
jgi:uncharacterized protein YjbI with pentapeptide repeats